MKKFLLMLGTLLALLENAQALDEKEMFDRFMSLTGTYEEDLHRFKQKPDIAIITSPDSQHYEQALVLLKEQIPLLIEKPSAVSSAQVATLSTMAQKYKTPVYVGYNYRTCPIHQQVKEIQLDLADIIKVDCFIVADVFKSLTQTDDYTDFVMKLAIENNLLISGGNDYHSPTRTERELGLYGNIDNRKPIPMKIFDNLWQNRNKYK